MKNPNCDNDKCRRDTGQVRVLPTGGDSNAILCYYCYLQEMNFRRERNLDLAPDCQFKLPEWESLKVYGDEPAPGSTGARLQSLCDLITRQQQQELISKGYKPHNHDHESHFHVGNKFARVDVGDSGKYMVDLKTGEIFGIKAYGVIHRGYRFGTLDTINEWNWGGYRAVKIQTASKPDPKLDALTIA